MAGLPRRTHMPRGRGSFQPYAVLRNNTNAPIRAKVTANYLNGKEAAEVFLGDIDLTAKAIKQIRMEPLLANAGLAKLNGYVNLTISFQGHHGDILISTGSVDQTKNYVFAVPAMPEQHTQGKIFCYWQLVNDTDTMLTLWNYTSRYQDLVLTFVYLCIEPADT